MNMGQLAFFVWMSELALAKYLEYFQGGVEAPYPSFLETLVAIWGLILIAGVECSQVLADLSFLKPKYVQCRGKAIPFTDIRYKMKEQAS